MTCPKCDGIGSILEETILNFTRAGQYVCKKPYVKSRGYDPDTVWDRKKCMKCNGTGMFRESSERM